MDTVNHQLRRTMFKRRLDPALKNMASAKKTRQLSVIVQSVDGVDERIKKHIKKHGGRITEEYPFIKACNALVPPPAIKSLETLSHVHYLSPNRPVAAHLNNIRNVLSSGTAHNQGLTGRNINVALLDTGTYPHPDLIRPANRILYFKDLVNGCEFPYDDNGHGTFVAGIILGNGSMSKGEYAGIAPGAGLISLKVLNRSGNGWTSTVLSGMQWIYDNREKYKIKLMCLPLGHLGSLSAENDPLSRAAQVLWDCGVIVCASAGNNGPEASWISSPGINPSIITVGALQGYGGTILPANPLAPFSSRGYTPDGNPGLDFVAPGTGITSLNSDPCFMPKSPLSHRSTRLDSHYRQGSGTSAACAAVSGTICLLLEKHGDLTPDEVKSLLKHSCKSLNLLKEQQGHGLPDINRLLD
ncbi:MAG: S8 family peptidase [Clostridia bacterium]|jgi:serine protease AprX|nr:S8 family peptidase [Clostridiales bacterium]